MPLSRPTLIQIPAFDATNEQTFTFAVYGATAQVTANRLIIRNQSTNETVYDQTQETFRYEHNLPANTLQNNTYYNATIAIIDAAGNQSSESIPIQFWCYTTPTITFTNIPLGNLIPNASFNCEFTYNQSEGEALNTYIVNLYSSTQSLISTSGEVYIDDGTPPYNGSYLFAGFEDSTVYYIEIVGTTIESTQISTGLIQITIQYTQPDIFAIVEIHNNCVGGYISIQSNIALIEGDSNPDPPTYIDNKEVDLREDGTWVNWDSGYSITGDFLSRIWLRDPNPYKTILQFSNISGQIITLNYMEGYENIDSENPQSYFELYVTSAQGLDYYIYSNFIDILPPEQYYNIWLTRINNIYKLQIAAVPTT